MARVTFVATAPTVVLTLHSATRISLMRELRKRLPLIVESTQPIRRRPPAARAPRPAPARAAARAAPATVRARRRGSRRATAGGAPVRGRATAARAAPARPTAPPPL